VRLRSPSCCDARKRRILARRGLSDDEKAERRRARGPAALVMQPPQRWSAQIDGQKMRWSSRWISSAARAGFCSSVSRICSALSTGLPFIDRTTSPGWIPARSAVPVTSSAAVARGRWNVKKAGSMPPAR
jgi:hypothetical protein